MKFNSKRTKFPLHLTQIQYYYVCNIHDNMSFFIALHGGPQVRI